MTDKQKWMLKSVAAGLLILLFFAMPTILYSLFGINAAYLWSIFQALCAVVWFYWEWRKAGKEATDEKS